MREEKVIARFMKKAESSNEEILYKDEWLSLRKRNYYTFVHEEKSNGRGVAVLGFKRTGKDSWDFVGRYEETLPHGKGIKLTSLTGQIEEGLSPEETAVKEFLEEAGVTIDLNQLIPLGKVFPYKAADTTTFLFAVDCADLEIGDAKGDGTEGEKEAYCEWISDSQLAGASCPLLHSLYTRGRKKGLFY